MPSVKALTKNIWRNPYRTVSRHSGTIKKTYWEGLKMFKIILWSVITASLMIYGLFVYSWVHEGNMHAEQQKYEINRWYYY